MITANHNTFLSQPLYITTPIFYPSGRPHIGHAYSLYAADTLARLHRQGSTKHTWFVTGTDEHGEKLQRAADQNGESPQSWVNRLVADAWQPLPATLGVSPDDFIRTTQQRHVVTVQNFIQQLWAKGHIYLGLHAGLYCVDCEEKKTSSEVVSGSGEFAGQKVCDIHKRPLKTVEEENYFFRLSAFTQPLLDLYQNNPNFVQPAQARNEVLGLLREGLEDLSISRTSFDWGIRVPWDEQHVIYVWFDALLNYLTAIGYDGVAPALPKLYSAATHLIGRDILRFHAVVLPALLLAHGLAFPQRVIAHGWLLNRGEKIAKSSGNAIQPQDLIEEFGADALRYYLLRTIPLGQDGGFSRDALADFYNSVLTNGYGNLASRLVALLQKHAEAVVPARGNTRELDLRLVGYLASAYNAVAGAETKDVIRVLLEQGESVISATNAYLTAQEPWRLAKDDSQQDRVLEILGTATYAFLNAARLLAASLPSVSAAVEHGFGVSFHGQLFPVEVAGAKVVGIAPLFPRLK